MHNELLLVLRDELRRLGFLLQLASLSSRPWSPPQETTTIDGAKGVKTLRFAHALKFNG